MKLSELIEEVGEEDTLVVVAKAKYSGDGEAISSAGNQQDKQPFYVEIIQKDTNQAGESKSKIHSIVYDQTSSTTPNAQHEYKIVEFNPENKFYGQADIHQNGNDIEFTEEEKKLFCYTSSNKQKLHKDAFIKYMRKHNTFSDKHHEIMCDIINSMDEINNESRALFFRNNNGEMILQQSAYSIISSLFQNFARNGELYSADQKVYFPYKLRAKISNQNVSDSFEEQNYSYTVSPDANIKMTTTHGSLGVMELKAGNEKNHEDIFRMITMTMMTACGIVQHLKNDGKWSTTDGNTSPIKFDIPFVFGNFTNAYLYTTQYNSENNPPIQVLRLKMVEYSNLDEIVHILIVMLGRLQDFSKKYDLAKSDWNKFDSLLTFSQTVINKNGQDGTKNDKQSKKRSGPSESSSSNSKKAKTTSGEAKDSAEFDENCARIVASCDGQISDLQYPWERPAPLWLGEEGGDYSECYQSRYPFYFVGRTFIQGGPKLLTMTSSPITSNTVSPSSSPTALDRDDDLKVEVPMSSHVCGSPKSSSQQVQVFCKVWLEGNKRTTRNSIQHEIDMLRLVNENDIPSPHLIEELTCFDLTDSKVANKTYHILTMTKVPNDEISQSDLSTFVKSFLGAVKKCHNAGILHCDIKPPNVAWNNKIKTVSLLDFGISQKVNGASNIGYTEGYGAPEIVDDGSCPTYESDVYSVGKTLMNMSEKCLKSSSCNNDFGERKESCIGNDIVQKLKDQVFMKLCDLSPTNRMNLEQAQNEVDKLTMNIM